MTYVVGWSPYHRDGGALELACHLARTGGDDVQVVAVTPSGWAAQLGGRAERNFEEESRREGERACTVAKELLRANGVRGEAAWYSGRSVPQVLLEQTARHDARLLVVGSGREGAVGRIGLSSKLGRLLHSSEVPVAVAPRHYRVGAQARVERITCAFRDAASSEGAMRRTAQVCARWGVSMRVVTFGVEPRRMYPTEVGAAERHVLQQWLEQAEQGQRDVLRLLRAEGECPEREQVAVHTVTGRDWDDALDQVEWGPHDLLVVGSSSTHLLSQVFLGSSASKILQRSPVPVVAVP